MEESVGLRNRQACSMVGPSPGAAAPGRKWREPCRIRRARRIPRAEEATMNGAESLVRTLVAGGINVCFTNPGTSEMHFVAALDKVDGIR